MGSRFITTVVALIISLSGVAQINMGNSSDTACTGFFFDSGSGGTGSPYTGGLQLTQTICPASGNFVSINFFDFDLGAGDTLWVYEGNSATGVPLDTFTAATVLPGLQVSNPNVNPSGCLTFVFYSDTSSTTVGNGWAAEVSCNPPCQNIFIQVDSTSPDTAGPAGEMDVCIGDTAYWYLSGLYTMNNTWYNQNDSNVTFNWYERSANGDTLLTGSGSNFQIPFDSSGGYIVNVVITDSNGCTNVAPYEQIVRVSTPPSFNGTAAFSDSICFGFTNDLAGQVQSVSWTNYLPPFSGDSVALPDASAGNPGIYSSNMSISNFPPGQTVTTVADIDNVWMNVEHSFLGDLSITLTCPNASTVALKSFPGGGGNWLGRPCDNGGMNVPVGVPFYYEWPANAVPANGIMNTAGTVGSTDPCSGFAGNTLPSGTYTTNSAYSNLIGCPLNGTWSITVVDQWGADDGHLVSWGIAFDSTILPPTVINFDPGVDTSWWTVDSSIISSSGATATVQPAYYDSLFSYQYNMTDNFGCSYDTTVSFWVKNPCDPSCLGNIIPSMGQFPAACVGDSSGFAWASPIDTLSPGPYDFYWTNPTGDTVAIHLQKSGTDTAFGLPSGMHTVAIIDSFGCTITNSVFVSSVQPMILNVSGIEQTTCAGNFCDGEADVTVMIGGTAPYNYLWSSGGTGISDSLLCSGANYVVVTDNRGCQDTATLTVPEPDSIDVTSFGTDTICISNVHTVNAAATGGNGGYSYVWSNGAGATSSVQVNPSVTTTYTVTATDSLNCPIDTASVTIYVRDPISVSLADVDTVCPGDTAYAMANAKGGDGSYNYSWSHGFGPGNTTQALPTQSEWLYVTVSDQCGTSPIAVDSTWMQVGGYSPIQVATNEDDTVCLGEAYVLTAQARGGVPPYVYDWGNGLGQGEIHAVLPNQTTTYSVTVSDFCNSVAGVGSITVHVGNFSAFEAKVDTAENCQPARFKFMVEPYNPVFSYDWNFGDGFRTYNMSDSIAVGLADVGCHDVQLRVTTDLGCVTTKSFNCLATVRPKPIADFVYDPFNPNIVDAQVTFSQTSAYASSYQWYIDDTLRSNNPEYVHFFSDSGGYDVKLTVSNAYKCVDSTEVNLEVDYRSTIFIPSGFTPNGDGLNDVFLPEGDGLTSLEIEIFNRWGNLVHSSTGLTEGWDGTYNSSGEPAEVGVYIYQIRYAIHNGKFYYKRGDVRLMR